MTDNTPRRTVTPIWSVLRKHRPLVLFLMLVGTTTVLLAVFFHPAATAGEQADKFSDPQKHALSVALEMNKLVVSLATLVFGAAGALVFTKDGAPRVTTAVGRVLVVLVLYFAALAIYFSYVAYDKLVEMLSNEFMDLNSDLLAEPRRLQVYALTASVVLLGMLVISILTASKGEPHAEG